MTDNDTVRQVVKEARAIRDRCGVCNEPWPCPKADARDGHWVDRPPQLGLILQMADIIEEQQREIARLQTETGVAYQAGWDDGQTAGEDPEGT